MEALQCIPASYNKLPSLFDAEKDFRSARANSLVSNGIRQLFIEHKMDTTFGVTMLHRHFDLADNELLVEYNGTSTPWDMTGRPETASCLRPTLWGLTQEGLLQPYEFEFAPNKQEPVNFSKQEYREFFTKLSCFLKEMKVERLFGLVKYPGDDWEGVYEITEGRANINIQPQDIDLSNASAHPITASWFFSPALWGAALNDQASLSCGPDFKAATFDVAQETASMSHEQVKPNFLADTAKPEVVPIRKVGHCLPYTRANGDSDHRYVERKSLSSQAAANHELAAIHPELDLPSFDPAISKDVPIGTQKLVQCFGFYRADGSWVHKKRQAGE